LEQLTQLQSAFDLDSEDESEEIFAADTTAEFDSEIIKAQLAQLQSAFDLDKSVSVNKEDNSPQEDALNLEKLTKSLSPGDSETSSHTIPQLSQASTDKLVRVPSSQLKKFNNLLEDLILERNKINAKLKQLAGTSSLLQRRIEQIAGSNTRLKQWYDRASVEGFLRYSQQPTTPADYQSLTRQQQTFDALEMDRYSDIHLLVQEQIETIVQLEEAAKDIELDLQDMSQAVQKFNHTTKSLQNNANKTQMLPFSEVSKRFPRLIRELSLQFNKQINLQIKGENTLIDRSVIDSLIDPLMHLLRNAFDHGIEDQETRLAANKLATATISLEAKNQGTHTIITVSDDGKGISLDKIRQRLHALGYPADEIKQMSEKQLLDCIFEPGFSTAQKVTEISGRGVGMDVVRTNLGEIRGDVAVQTNLGKGTTFKLRIPFSLSILRVVIIEQAGITLAIPANTIKELFLISS
ncbi:MAG: hybrid sensor histidine kinase/response regulator, partial [Cyanobacteria bacterium J083]